MNWQNSTTGGSGSMPFGSGDGFSFDATPFQELDWLWLLPVAALVALIGLAILLGILIWVVSVIAEGGLIAGVNSHEADESSSFGQAWSAAWARGWRLIGISLIPGIPMLVLLALGVAAFILTAGLAISNLEEISAAFGIGFIGLGLCLACLLVPIIIVLEVLRIFAMRACVLEDNGVIDAYRRGIAVIRENQNDFIALLLLRVGLGIAIGLVLFLPGMVMAVCCILWPLLLVVRGAIAAYFSALWTLAWRQWTGMPPAPLLPEQDLSLPEVGGQQ